MYYGQNISPVWRSLKIQQNINQTLTRNFYTQLNDEILFANISGRLKKYKYRCIGATCYANTGQNISNLQLTDCTEELKEPLQKIIEFE